MAGGRPTKYDARYADEARKLAMLGATDVEMAAFWGITEKTLNNWKASHPEFFQSLKEGKMHADSSVAESLYKRAMGYSHEAVKIMQYEGSPVIVPYTEKYPPDTAAAIFWLKNRRKVDWRDKIEQEISASEDLAKALEQAWQRNGKPAEG